MNTYINRWKSNVELHNQKLKNLRSSLSRQNKHTSTGYHSPGKKHATSGGFRRDMTPPDFNRDLEQVLRETSEGRKGEIQRSAKKRKEYVESSPDDDTEEEEQRHTLREQSENRKEATDVCVEKLEKLIAQKLAKGKRKAKIKQILSSFQKDLQRERDENVAEARRLRSVVENSKTRNETTNRMMEGIETKLMESERTRVELRNQRDKLNARITQLEQERQAQSMSSEVVKMLKESHDALLTSNLGLREALQEQKGMFNQERVVWTNELNLLRQKLAEVIKYGGGSLGPGASLMTINGSPKDSSSMAGPRGTGGFMGSTSTRKAEMRKEASQQQHKRENTIIESPYLVADADEDEGKESSNLSQIFRSEHKGFEFSQE